MPADLPIVIRKCAAFIAAFPYPINAIRRLLPHPMLVPAMLVPRKGVLVVAVLDFQDTSIGPYREVGIGFQCRLRSSGALPFVPLLLDRLFDDVAPWMQILPASTQASCDVGRGSFGLPKFLADIDVGRAGDRVTCEVREGGSRIFQVSIDRPSAVAPMAMPVRMYSALREELLFTEMMVDAVGSVGRIGARARLEIDDHPRARDLDRAAIASAKPIEVRWLEEYRTMIDRPSIRYRMSA